MSFWKNKRVLVTGNLGFIGSHLNRRLSGLGAIVSGLDYFHDIRNIANVEGAFIRDEPEVVFHLAAQSLVSAGQAFPRATIETNVIGTLNLLETCRKFLVQSIVIASTDKVYGRAPAPYGEDSPLLGNEQIYEASKLCEDTLAHAYRESYDLPIMVARCGNVYGPGDTNYSRLIPGAMRAFIKKEPFAFRSPKSFRRDYNYVDDIVDAYLLCAERGLEHPNAYAYNFGSGIGYNSAQIVGQIANMFPYGVYVKEQNEEKDGEIPNQCVDATLAKTDLGWSPKHSLNVGLSNTLDWYKEHITGENF